MERIGIALFTYDKYRKTVDSNVALDAHGNVIQLDSEYLSGEGSTCGHDVELSARPHDSRPLHSSVSRLKKGIVYMRPVTEASTTKIEEGSDGEIHRQLLFSGEGLDEGEEDAEEIQSLRSSKLNWGDETNKTRKGV